MSTSLIRGRYLVCRATGRDAVEMFEDAALFQREGEIVEIGPYDALKARHPDAAEIGTRDHLVMPGLVNAHHHIGVTHPIAGCLDGPLELWLTEVWARRDVDPYLDTLWGACQLLRSGVTTVMHNVVRWIVPAGDALLGVSERILAAYREAGMRVAYSIGMKEHNVIAYGDDETIPSRAACDSLERARPAHRRGPLRRRLPRALRGALPAARGRRRRPRAPAAEPEQCAMGVGQSVPADQGTGRALRRRHPHAPRGDRLPGGLCAADLRQIAGSAPGRARLPRPGAVVRSRSMACRRGSGAAGGSAGTVICHNPSSNLRLQSGIAPVQRMLEAGLTVALGADSSGINDDQELLQEVRLASALHRGTGTGHDAPRLTPADLLRMATASGAQACRFGDLTGTLEVGKRADAVLMNLDRMTEGFGMSEAVPVLELLFQRGRDRHIDAVLVDGEVVFSDGRPTRFDAAEVVSELRQRFSQPLAAHEQERRALAAALRPYVRAFYRGWI